ncbi:gon-4-like protein isoform x1 [Limosa lapponica baueri]|uniref:Gon-4-like protein isoform x1 n=1 Tax=Limosa lapponica baueri TaxID=1758121 RepID=A0A2I0TLA4_LIMLA|nr:gon-4-like protein isoform x1 [Limosa lapponica baueri]
MPPQQDPMGTAHRHPSEDEADDDDDPEYNFLEDLDEPDTEDFRNDRAVRITIAAFESVCDLSGDPCGKMPPVIPWVQILPDDTNEIGWALKFEEPLANLLNEQHRTVKEQLEQLRMKKSSIKPPQEIEKSKPQNEKPLQSLVLDSAQRKRLQQQMQQYYKKTKQLPVLFKCCEEIQPNEWKPPVEREEHRLPFWLKASLSSIQGELKQLAEDAREMPGSPDAESVFLGTGKETSDTECDEKYPLLMPKGLVLTLKPLANRFSRRAWRRQRSSALKPVLIRPSPCLQPSSSTINIQKTVKLSQSEAPPSKVMVQIPRLIQPAPVMQTVPGVQPLSVPAVVGSGDGLEFQNVLSASHSDSRQAFSGAVPPALVPSNPVTFQPKLMLPALAGAKIRKPCVRKGYQKKKGTKSASLIKTSPLIQPSPVILTVPATTVKVVNIGNGCNMIQPINTTVGRGTQAIPVTTLLVNPSTFPCPLNQPLVTSSIPSLLVSPNPVSLSASSVGENEEQLNLVPSCPAGNNKNTYPTVEPKVEPPELYVSCSTVSPKKESSTNPGTSNSGRQEKVNKGNCCSWAVVEGGENASEPLSVDLLPHLEDPDEAMKIEPEDANDASKEVSPVQKRDLLCAEVKEEFMLDLGQELNMEAACSCSNDLKEIKKEHPLCDEKGEEERQALQSSPQGEQQMDAGSGAGPQVSSESPKNLPYTADVEAEFSSPLGRPEDSSSIDGQSVGTPAGPEAGGEREGQEEEEEDDFDDFTQDEDEEMSSASEESILSVPELQVREALQHVPGKYEDFLRVIYEFEISTDKRTAVDLYSTLQKLLHDWPQLLTDFAAFLLPEQALECGLFEEQQAFEKSRKFLRQLEICFAENPAHHQKIIKVLQSCADCLPQEITELKTQMWQLLKGHDHLQDEFSIFFDHLRPSASRMGDFEEINWTEEKEYEVEQSFPQGQKR